MLCYYLMYRAAIYRHRYLARALGQPYHSHDYFVHRCYWWWL